MIIYQTRKGEILMLNITIPVLNEFQAGWIVLKLIKYLKKIKLQTY